jgi:hypothetical protein
MEPEVSEVLKDENDLIPWNDYIINVHLLNVFLSDVDLIMVGNDSLR